MFTRDTAIDYARKYVSECLRNEVKVQKAFLFGSYANGEARKYSDIDVALVSDMFIENPIYNWKLLSPVNIKFLNIEPHPFSASEFLEGNPFIDEIKKTGIELSL